MANKITYATGGVGSNVGGTTSYVEIPVIANTFTVNSAEDVVMVDVATRLVWEGSGSSQRSILVAYSLDGGVTKTPIFSADEKGTTTYATPVVPQANIFLQLSPGTYTIKFYTKAKTANSDNMVRQDLYHTHSTVIVWGA